MSAARWCRSTPTIRLEVRRRAGRRATIRSCSRGWSQIQAGCTIRSRATTARHCSASCRDPLRFGGGSTNLFIYGLNNPVSNVDPLGQDVCPGGDCAGGGGGQQPTVFVPPGLVDQIFNPISWFESLFDFLFGGGGHQQVVIPRKLRYRPHIIFAQYSGLSRDLVVAQADEEEDRAEKEEMESNFLQNAFAGRSTFTPSEVSFSVTTGERFGCLEVKREGQSRTGEVLAFPMERARSD